MSTTWPILHYDDPRAAVTFLVDVLGFRSVVAVADDEGDVVHAELAWLGGGSIVVGGTKHTDGVHGSMRPGSSAVYLVTDHVDAVHERVRRDGTGTEVQPPAATTFGNGATAYAGTVADPEGNLWTVGTYAGS